jgi:hypothetical protein
MNALYRWRSDSNNTMKRHDGLKRACKKEDRDCFWVEPLWRSFLSSSEEEVVTDRYSFRSVESDVLLALFRRENDVGDEESRDDMLSFSWKLPLSKEDRDFSLADRSSTTLVIMVEL